jgi:hypothetical protein
LNPGPRTRWSTCAPTCEACGDRGRHGRRRNSGWLRPTVRTRRVRSRCGTKALPLQQIGLAAGVVTRLAASGSSEEKFDAASALDPGQTITPHRLFPRIQISGLSTNVAAESHDESGASCGNYNQINADNLNSEPAFPEFSANRTCRVHGRTDVIDPKRTSRLRSSRWMITTQSWRPVDLSLRDAAASQSLVRSRVATRKCDRRAIGDCGGAAGRSDLRLRLSATECGLSTG